MGGRRCRAVHRNSSEALVWLMRCQGLLRTRQYPLLVRLIEADGLVLLDVSCSCERAWLSFEQTRINNGPD